MPISPSKSKVCFFFQAVSTSLKNRTALKKFILTIFRKEGKQPGTINYIFCTDKAILDINRQFLQHDFYTDIITFDLSEGGSALSDIYISVDRVKENALKLGISNKEELHRVIFHGILHLCGYGDKNKRDKEEMRLKEDFYLSLYFK
ncbi:MAG: rRNA maturation RNase YbeY [Chitinophagaceae bacterium]